MKVNPKKYYGLEPDPDPDFPDAYHQKQGWTFLFRLVSRTEEARFLPLFRYFATHTKSSGPNEWIPREAEMALQSYDLQERGVFVRPVTNFG